MGKLGISLSRAYGPMEMRHKKTGIWDGINLNKCNEVIIV